MTISFLSLLRHIKNNINRLASYKEQLNLKSSSVSIWSDFLRVKSNFNFGNNVNSKLTYFYLAKKLSN